MVLTIKQADHLLPGPHSWPVSDRSQCLGKSESQHLGGVDRTVPLTSIGREIMQQMGGRCLPLKGEGQ